MNIMLLMNLSFRPATLKQIRVLGGLFFPCLVFLSSMIRSIMLISRVVDLPPHHHH